MAGVINQWDPNDWEEFSHSLLHARHGVLNVHKVPADHQGDLGVDYYCVSDSVIYQCYAVTEPVHIDVRAQRQKDKITTDLRKLVRGAAEVSKLLLGAQLKAWVFALGRTRSLP